MTRGPLEQIRFFTRVRQEVPAIPISGTTRAAVGRLGDQGWTVPDFQALIGPVQDADLSGRYGILQDASETYGQYHHAVTGQPVEESKRTARRRTRAEWIAWQHARVRVRSTGMPGRRGPIVDDLAPSRQPLAAADPPSYTLATINRARSLGLTAADVHLLADAGVRLAEMGPNPRAWMREHRAQVALLAAYAHACGP